MPEELPFKDPRGQVMAIITAFRTDGGRGGAANQLLKEMSKHDMERSLAFLIVSHIKLVEIVAQYTDTTADAIYRSLAIEAAKG
jgi:hypothetical protein